ncbi:MAG: ABC transporter substrate-binding protein [bacterium]
MSKNMWVKLVIFGLCVALGMVFVFAVGTTAKVKLRYSYWGSFDEDRTHRTMAEKFIAKNPDVEIECVHIPAQYEQKLQVELAAGVAPDVMFFQDEPFPSFVRTGVFENLHDRIMADTTIDLNDFFPGTKEYFMYKGKQWSLPADGGPSSTVIYNVDHFKEAGLKTPWKEWTYVDFLEAAKKLTKDKDGDGKIDQFGFTISTWYARSFAWLDTFGGAFMRVVDPENRDIVISEAGSEESIAAFKFLQDLRWKHHVMPTPAELEILGPQQFLAGKISIQEDGPWALQELRPARASKGLNFDLAHCPTGPKGYKSARQSFDTWVLYAGSKNKNEAYKFISFLHGPEGQIEFAKLGRAIPGRVSIAYTDYFLRPDTPENEKIFLEIMEEYAMPQPTSAYWYEADPMITEWIDRLWLNKATPEEVGKNIEKNLNDLFKKGWPGGKKPVVTEEMKRWWIKKK